MKMTQYNPLAGLILRMFNLPTGYDINKRLV